MRITDIRQEGRYFVVDLVPNKVERFFGVKPKTLKYKDSGSEYMFGSQTIYIDPDGNKTSNHHWISEEIDRYRRQKDF